MTIIPIGDYTPDQPAYMSGNVTWSANTYPRDNLSDGPLLSGEELTDATVGVTCGAFAVRSSAGTTYVFAGDDKYLYEQTGVSLSDVTAASYSYSADFWTFTRFGDQVLASNLNDPIQEFTLGSSTKFANLAAAAWKARFISTFEPGFVMLGYVDDGGTTYPNGVRWSGINDATSWETVGTASAAAVQSDYQLLQAGGYVTGLAAGVGGAAGVVMMDEALYRVEYAGSPTVFNFRLVDDRKGSICRNGSAVVNGILYFISHDGFCAYDGNAIRQIGFSRIDAKFLNEVNRAKLDHVWCAVDYDRKCVIWAYPAAGASYPNRWLIYSYAADRWRYGDADELACTLIFTGRQAGYTLDTLDTILPAGVDGYGSFSVDDPLFTGGKRGIMGFSSANKLQAYIGPSLQARFETGEADINGNRVFVSGIKPLTDSTGVASYVRGRNSFGSTPSVETPYTVGSDGWAPARTATRYARAGAVIPASEAWTYFQGFDVRFRPEGRR